MKSVKKTQTDPCWVFGVLRGHSQLYSQILHANFPIALRNNPATPRRPSRPGVLRLAKTTKTDKFRANHGRALPLPAGGVTSVENRGVTAATNGGVTRREVRK